MKIVLANTVGIDSGGWSVIPYASRWTTASKGHDYAFTYYPRDLAYLSSLLKRETPYDVKLADGCLERLDREKYADKIAALAPDWLVMENSTRTFEDDLWVAKEVAGRTGAKVMLTGQHVTAFPDEGFKGGADVVVRGEYLKSALDFFREGALTRGVIPFDPSGLIEVADLPFPEDEDVSRYEYALKADNICEYREIQVYTSRGCPYSCVYCVARHAYYGSPKWRARPVENVIAELLHLAGKYPGLEGFFFDDEIHNARISYVKELSRAMIAAGLGGYKTEAMCAYAPFDEESLALMKEAGYYKVRVGIETASDAVAEALRLKGKHRPDRLGWFLDTAKRIGIKVYATFAVGGAGSAQQEDAKTIALMGGLIEKDLIDDCQVSILTPQPGAPFYTWARSRGYMGTAPWSRFDGGEEAVMSLPGYPAEMIRNTRLAALDEYDRARKARDERVYMENWREDAQKIRPAPGRILIFRSCRAWGLDLLIRAILETWGEAKTALLVHAGHAGSWRSSFPGLNIIETGETGFLNWDRLEPGVRGEIKNFAADIALIPANTDHLRGYGNVLAIARGAGAGRIFHVSSKGRIVAA